MILNAFRAIVAGWAFQLNGDVTGKLCRKNIDLVECNEKAIDSKVKYSRASAVPPRELVVPAAEGVVMPSSSDDFEVWPLVIAHGVHV